MAGVIGCIQATEALKAILDIGQSLSGRLLIYDALSMKFDTLAINKDPNCPVCGDMPSITKLEDISVACAPAASDDAITAQQLKSELQKGKQITLA